MKLEECGQSIDPSSEIWPGISLGAAERRLAVFESLQECTFGLAIVIQQKRQLMPRFDRRLEDQ